MCDLVEDKTPSPTQLLLSLSLSLSLSLYCFQRFLPQISRCVLLCLQSLHETYITQIAIHLFWFFFFSLLIFDIFFDFNKRVFWVREQTWLEREKEIEQLMGKKRPCGFSTCANKCMPHMSIIFLSQREMLR